MKSSLQFLRFPVVALAFLAASVAAYGESATPVYVDKPLLSITVPAGTASSKVKLKKTFALTGVTGSMVRFSTTEGNVDVQLLSGVAPQSVANFLGYVNNGAYNNSFFHRSVPNFILQGGGYFVADGNVNKVVAGPSVVNEFKLSNTRGTIAMAKLGGDPNSATNEWFFNQADNSGNLDNQNGGFTVFGTVMGDGMNIVDAIMALTIVNAGSPFDNLPVLSSYDGSMVSVSDLVYVKSIAPIPLVPKVTGDPAVLKLKVALNSNPNLVTAATISGSVLTLNYAPGITGSSTITVQAKSSAKKDKTLTSFTVTVQ